MNSIIARQNGNLLPSREDFFHPFEQHFNKIFDEFFDEGTNIKNRVGYPKLDVMTENGQFKVQVALPGVKPENIKVEIVPQHEGVEFGRDVPSCRILKISGKMDDTYQSTGAHYHVKELRRSSFERSVLLPDYVQDDPQAVMKDGLLMLTWKTPEVQFQERKTIPIKVE